MYQEKQIHSVLKGPFSSAHNGVLGRWVGDGLGQVEETHFTGNCVAASEVEYL